MDECSPVVETISNISSSGCDSFNEKKKKFFSINSNVFDFFFCVYVNKMNEHLPLRRFDWRRIS